jgi:hypothetical protein
MSHRAEELGPNPAGSEKQGAFDAALHTVPEEVKAEGPNYGADGKVGNLGL